MFSISQYFSHNNGLFLSTDKTKCFICISTLSNHNYHDNGSINVDNLIHNENKASRQIPYDLKMFRKLGERSRLYSEHNKMIARLLTSTASTKLTN